MTILALVLLLAAASVPSLDRPLRRWLGDPVLAVALLSVALLGAAAIIAAAADEPTGWVGSAAWGAAAALGVAVAVCAGSHVVRGVFRLTRNEIRPGRSATPAAAAPAPASDGSPLDLPAGGPTLRGGAWIGYLERASVSATLLAGFPEGIALVLAVKGVGRYPELREPGSHAPEEFIIGTLTSLLWASAAAGAAILVR